MADALENLSFKELQNRCRQFGIRPCADPGITKQFLIREIRKAEGRVIAVRPPPVRGFPPSSPPPSSPPSRVRGTLRDELGEDLDVFARGLAQVIDNVLWEVKVNLNTYIETGQGTSTSALYYNPSDPDLLREGEVESVSEDYLYMELGGETLSVTAAAMIYDYNIDRDPTPDTLRLMASIANYGFEKLAKMVYDELHDERISIGDRYTLLVQEVKVKLDDPSDLPQNIETYYDSAMALIITIAFEAVDEREYIAGGLYYEKAREGFESRRQMQLTKDRT